MASAYTESHLAPWGDEYERWGVYTTNVRPATTPDGDLALRYVPEGAALDRKLAALYAMASQRRGLRPRRSGYLRRHDRR